MQPLSPEVCCGSSEPLPGQRSQFLEDGNSSNENISLPAGKTGFLP